MKVLFTLLYISLPNLIENDHISCCSNTLKKCRKAENSHSLVKPWVMVIHEPCGLFFFFFFFWHFLSFFLSWTILLNKAYVVMWTFGKPLTLALSTWFMYGPLVEPLFNTPQNVPYLWRLTVIRNKFWTHNVEEL